MLNRKASNYIFYAMLGAIALVVLLIRLALLGNINARIDEVHRNSQFLQTRIDYVDEIVASYRDTQENHLYELYDLVPAEYDADLLKDYVSAQVRIYVDTSAAGFQMDVDINVNPSLPPGDLYDELEQNFDIVEVQVEFTVSGEDAVDQIKAFIDEIYGSQQIFVFSDINYRQTTGTSNILVNINFFAFYKK